MNYALSKIVRLSSFGLVGLVGTAAHYCVLVALVESAVSGPVSATMIGFIIGATINYSLNRRYTFQSKKAHLDVAPKFLLVALITGLLNSFVVYVGVDKFSFNYLWVQVSATTAVFLTNFVINDIWTFRELDST